MKRVLISTAGGWSPSGRGINNALKTTISDMVSILNREKPTVEVIVEDTREGALERIKTERVNVLICLSQSEIEWAKTVRASQGTDVIVLTGLIPDKEIVILQKPIRLETLSQLLGIFSFAGVLKHTGFFIV